MKVSLDEVNEELLYSWEEMYGTDCTTWYENYQLHLPYWVGYMSKQDQLNYVDNIKKTKEFEQENK